ncbi:MAG: hypothetical protein WCP52_13500, partial [Bacteroidota bacterium]
ENREQNPINDMGIILEKIADNNTQMMGYFENVIEKITNVMEKVIDDNRSLTSNHNTLVQTNNNNKFFFNNNK